MLLTPATGLRLARRHAHNPGGSTVQSRPECRLLGAFERRQIRPMKLIRCGEPGKEKPGILRNDGTRVDVSQFVPDYDERFFAEDGLHALRQWLDRNESTAPRVSSSMRLGPPICRPSKIICIGLNYRDHAAESGMELPREPVIFFKATSSLTGPNDPV